MKKTLTLGLSIAALAIAGTAAVAQTFPAARGDWATKTITRADAQTRAAAMFDRMDANHDGKLDQADRAAREAAMFARMDTDHNGQLSPAEFDAAHQMRGRDGDHADMAGMDHAGMAGMEHRGMGRMGGHKHGGMGRMGMMGGRMGDANKDGVVTRDEFVAGAVRRFDAGDTNHDGSLSPAERQASHSAMKAQWDSKRAAKTTN